MKRLSRKACGLIFLEASKMLRHSTDIVTIENLHPDLECALKTEDCNIEIWKQPKPSFELRDYLNHKAECILFYIKGGWPERPLKINKGYPLGTKRKDFVPLTEVLAIVNGKVKTCIILHETLVQGFTNAFVVTTLDNNKQFVVKPKQIVRITRKASEILKALDYDYLG